MIDKLKENARNYKKLRNQKATWLKVYSGSTLRVDESRWIDVLISHTISLRCIPPLISVAPGIVVQTATSSHNHLAYRIKANQPMIDKAKRENIAS